MTQYCHILLVFVHLLFVFSANAHKCIHDEYVASKNITQTISPQKYLNHPFENKTDTNASRRLLSANWQPIRIHVDSSDLAKHTFGDAAKKALQRITTSILPGATKLLSKYLQVIPVDGNLKIKPDCGFEIEGKPCCGQDPRCKWEPNTCADVAVPDDHHTPGIPNSDFVVYLTANENYRGAAMAVGVTCKSDQHRRPLAGQVSLNLANFLDSLSKNYLIAVLTHEMSHALGWNQDAFKEFRDENGNVRSNTVENGNILGKQITLLTTPAVTKQVRSHFGCASLFGMEIEDQGGAGTAGSHPEKRIFPETYMTGQLNEQLHGYIVDSMALSVFQDSGWYQVKNLDQAGRLAWGRGMGCRVPTHKCNDLGAKANALGLFCSNETQVFCTGVNKHVKGNCPISQYSGALPSNFQYFSSPTLGGKMEIADYCPRAAEYTNGDCTNLANAAGHESVAEGTKVSSESRCFVSSLMKNGYNPYNSKGEIVPVKRGTHCYRRTCNANSLEIQVGDTTVSCPVSNEPSTVSTVDGYHGDFVCPPYAGLNDARCSPLCSLDDPECLGIKGSMTVIAGATNNDVTVSPRYLRH